VSLGGKKNTEELSKMLKNRDNTRNDLNWNKELREDLQVICFLRRNSTVHNTVK
jgi:hypothetical protein